MSFLAVDGATRQARGAWKLRGVQLAIVVDNKDGPDNPGYRVKLVLPWLNDQEATFWARIAVPMGGPDRGTYVLPEIDDQVLVVFEHGDISRPIVIGGLWSKKQEPVEVNQSGKNCTKLIKSRTGHRIIFDDKEGAEKITIVDSTKQNKIVLDSVDKIVKIESSGDIAIEAKASVILHANALVVGTREGITGKARSVLGHAQASFGLKATTGLTIGGGTTTINTANAAATSVSGSGSGELGGAGAEPAKDQRVDHSARARGGGGGGGGGAAPGGSAQPGSGETGGASGAAPQDQLDWFAIELIDKDDKPVAMIRYKVVGPDGAVHTGLTDPDGRARIEGLSPGACTVTFPDLHAGEWGHA